MVEGIHFPPLAKCAPRKKRHDMKRGRNMQQFLPDDCCLSADDVPKRCLLFCNTSYFYCCRCSRPSRADLVVATQPYIGENRLIGARRFGETFSINSSQHSEKFQRDFISHIDHKNCFNNILIYESISFLFFIG